MVRHRPGKVQRDEELTYTAPRTARNPTNGSDQARL